ncbi:uncharacterized protein MELLADRAFT_63163 [Melampsora larici-populina 98AG31]|uniref:Uncharacterized protein n=1 Tax=Melampsora larici-populina (strain 98AG31 / pathotype 3-4-7) TaxID=747676 RepID=F4RLN2_MELLP|nr:uncharacterized protein MELLADRAFT_63163 [Melampsora larici-populina 98AG31]EGG06563.1 hypothetical protein MELLADRAFT_63163 [Melampsora larici-populina 98AG31]
MTSKRILRGLNNPARIPKPATPLQEQLQARRERDLRATANSTAAILKKLKDEEEPHRDLHDQDMAEGQVLNDVEGADEADEPQDEDFGEEGDLRRFMPHPDQVEHPQPVDPIIAALRRDQHLADRLSHENEWMWQYAVMLPTFLRCKMETSNWGNEDRWNKDLRPTCTCVMQTERNVDLVDLTSKLSIAVQYSL